MNPNIYTSRLRVMQRAIERAMIGITRKDRKTNQWIRDQTRLEDIVVVVKRLKWKWAGHVVRMNDNRWTKIITEWLPIENRRKRAMPKTRWVEELHKSEGVKWMRTEVDRRLWKNHKEAFIQQWIEYS